MHEFLVFFFNKVETTWNHGFGDYEWTGVNATFKVWQVSIIVRNFCWWYFFVNNMVVVVLSQWYNYCRGIFLVIVYSGIFKFKCGKQRRLFPELFDLFNLYSQSLSFIMILFSPAQASKFFTLSSLLSYCFTAISCKWNYFAFICAL